MAFQQEFEQLQMLFGWIHHSCQAPRGTMMDEKGRWRPCARPLVYNASNWAGREVGFELVPRA